MNEKPIIHLANRPNYAANQCERSINPNNSALNRLGKPHSLISDTHQKNSELDSHTILGAFYQTPALT